MVDRKLVLVGAGGVAAGSLLGYGVSRLLSGRNPPTETPLTLPAEFQSKAAELVFHDTVADMNLSGPYPLSVIVENGYTFWLVGYGLLGKGANDVLVEIVRTADTTPRYYCNIVKLGSNPIEINRSGVLMNTMPSLSGAAENTLQPAYLVLNL